MHIITGLGAGGAETMLVQLASSLRKKGWPQYVVSLKDRGVHADALEKAGVGVSALGIRSAFSAPLPMARLTGLVREFRPEVVQGWMYHGNLAALIAHRLSSGGDGRKLYWNLRASNMDRRRYGGIIRWGARFSGWPDMVIANSQAGRAFHLANGFRPKRIEVVPNGIDTAKFKPDERTRKSVREEFGIAPDAVVAIHIARVDPMKDQQNFLTAMTSCPDVAGILIGLHTDTLALPGNVRAFGQRHDIERLYTAADLIVSSSAFGEGFSNATAEGMASGLVPVVTDVGDARLIVGETGRVVAPRDPETLAAAIAAEAGAGRKQLREKGRRARRRIVENFTLDSAVGAFMKLYDRRDGA